MKDLETIRPNFDTMIYRWIQNGIRQIHAKRMIVESRNPFEIREARERLAFRESEAGTIRDELVGLFVKNAAGQPTFCDEYEFRLQQIWQANGRVEESKRRIVKAVRKNDKIAEVFFRDELKSDEIAAGLAVENLFRTLVDAMRNEERIA